MSLTIKNAETCRLAGELARVTGETMTGAITVALRERLERVDQGQDKAGRSPMTPEERLQRMREISGRAAALLRGTTGPGSVDHGDYFYDEHGLPK